MRTAPWIKILAVCQECNRIATVTEKPLKSSDLMAVGQSGPGPCLSYCSIAVTKLYDQNNWTNSFRGWETMTILAGAAGRQVCSWSSSYLDPQPWDKKLTGNNIGFWNFKIYPQWHTSSDATFLNPSQMVPSTGDCIFKLMNLRGHSNLHIPFPFIVQALTGNSVGFLEDVSDVHTQPNPIWR